MGGRLTGSALTLVLINNGNLLRRPTQRLSPLRQPILPPGTLRWRWT